MDHLLGTPQAGVTLALPWPYPTRPYLHGCRGASQVAFVRAALIWRMVVP